jgi:hypothetical protein
MKRLIKRIKNENKIGAHGLKYKRSRISNVIKPKEDNNINEHFKQKCKHKTIIYNIISNFLLYSI